MSIEPNPYAAPAAEIGVPVRTIYDRFNIASKGARFGTLIVDYICFLGLSIFIGVTGGLLFGEAGAQAIDNVPDIILGTSIMTVYYVFFEAIWARTPGKFVFGTVVVDENGGKPGFGRIFARTLCRFIPFEPLSCLTVRGWHDSIPKVYVIRKR